MKLFRCLFVSRCCPFINSEAPPPHPCLSFLISSSFIFPPIFPYPYYTSILPFQISRPFYISKIVLLNDFGTLTCRQIKFVVEKENPCSLHRSPSLLATADRIFPPKCYIFERSSLFSESRIPQDLFLQSQEILMLFPRLRT